MRRHQRSQAGFTYIGLLVAVVILGLLLTAASRVWSITEQRERETQLLFAGDAIREAIARYYTFNHQFPASLESLLADDRSAVARHYLRRLYADPMTGQPDWTPILASDLVGIMGVASSSKLVPIKRKGFEMIDSTFEDSDCYCKWQFVYLPTTRTHVKPPANPAPTPKPTQPGPLIPKPGR
jgi:type II secretory pathway pseudopilin PulG